MHLIKMCWRRAGYEPNSINSMAIIESLHGKLAEVKSNDLTSFARSEYQIML